MGLPPDVFDDLQEDIEMCILRELVSRFGRDRTVNFVEEVQQDNLSKGLRYKRSLRRILAGAA